MKNIGERIVILQEEVKFEDEKQEVLYSKYRELFEHRLKNLISKLTQNEHNELIQLEEKKMNEESEVLYLILKNSHGRVLKRLNRT